MFYYEEQCAWKLYYTMLHETVLYYIISSDIIVWISYFWVYHNTTSYIALWHSNDASWAHSSILSLFYSWLSLSIRCFSFSRLYIMFAGTVKAKFSKPLYDIPRNQWTHTFCFDRMICSAILWMLILIWNMWCDQGL